jgi:hypothetical protein
LRRVGGDLGNKFLHHGTTERLVVFRYYHKRAGPADDIVAVIFLDTARWIGVRRILGKLDVGQNHNAVDDDVVGNCPITEKSYVATGIIGAVARHVDGVALGFERRPGDLGGREVDGGTDGGAIVERSRGFNDQIGEVGRSSRAVNDAPIDYNLLLEGTRPIDEADPIFW